MAQQSLRHLLNRYCRARLNLRALAPLKAAVSRADRVAQARRARPAMIRDLSGGFIASVMRDCLADHRSERTANNARKSLLTLWRWAEDQGLQVRPVPRKPLPRLTEPELLPQAWTLAEVRRLAATAGEWAGTWAFGVPACLGWRLGISILWDSGARVGELLAARVGDVAMDSAMWTVPARNRKGRRRPKVYRLHPETVTLLRRRTEWGGDALWPVPWKRPQSLWDHFAKVVVAAGLPNDRWHKFHCLRRSSESLAASIRGVAWAASAVGHSEAVALRSYISPLVCPAPCLADAVPAI
ncbi:MAG: hypothetical protein IMZ55_15090 [Acidobacteria bacterium]|nr:hypothetical protein [Acidobacteriota bacterium]